MTENNNLTPPPPHGVPLNPPQQSFPQPPAHPTSQPPAEQMSPASGYPQNTAAQPIYTDSSPLAGLGIPAAPSPVVLQIKALFSAGPLTTLALIFAAILGSALITSLLVYLTSSQSGVPSL